MEFVTKVPNADWRAIRRIASKILALARKRLVLVM
jgi:hypothetical protein